MVSIQAVSKGLAKFVDVEILPKMDKGKNWVLGAAVGLFARNMEKNITEVAKLPVVKFLNILDDKGNVDIDVLYEEFSKQAAKGPAVIPLPDLVSSLVPNYLQGIVGKNEKLNLTLTAQDVDTLYRYIQEEK